MFWKFANFWIQNPKITIVVLITIIFAGLFSWYMIPKQYNPDIEVPAFQVTAEAPGYSSQQMKNLVTREMEQVFSEIEWIDDIQGTSRPNMAGVMVSFEVGMDKEVATTRLYNKIYSNLDLSPYGIERPEVEPIDPDEIPVYTVAVYHEDKPLDDQENMLQLRKIWDQLVDEFKQVDGTTRFYLNWAEQEFVNVLFDLEKMESRWVDLTQVIQTIQENNENAPGWGIMYDDTLDRVEVSGEYQSINDLEKLVVGYQEGSPVYLEDISKIYKWASPQRHHTFFTNHEISTDAVYIGVAKAPEKNSIFLIEDLEEKISKLQDDLPEGYHIKAVQDEWETAEDATNMLMSNLFQAVGIVFLVLLFYLGFRDALNNSIAIPLALGITFFIALNIWDNVNRITLFALILVLGMLVDNSTVVVENISRHLEERVSSWKDRLQAIKDAVNEVGFWVVLATITRILAFIGMFFVTGMMGEYMGPIPQYAIIALTASFFIAFSINPFIAYYFEKPARADESKEKYQLKDVDKVAKNWAHEVKTTKIERIYTWFLEFFIWEWKKLRRSFLKIFFWIALWFVVVTPIVLNVFKAQMLPKSDQDNFFVWIDMPRDTSLDKSQEVAQDLSDFVQSFSPEVVNEEYPSQDLNIVENASYWVGIPPVPDFANTFRGSAERQMPSQISARVNITPSEERQISSPEYVVKFRNILKEYILEKYPEAEIRVLEEPPGPPVQATYKMKISWDPGSSYDDIKSLNSWMYDKTYRYLASEKVEDVHSTVQDYQTTYDVKLDHEKVTRLELNAEQIRNTVYNVFRGSEISIFYDDSAREEKSIFVRAKDEYANDPDAFEDIKLTNPEGRKVPLTEVADIVPMESDDFIRTDDQRPTTYIYGEMWENSVVYPVIGLFVSFFDDEFWEWKFELIWWNPYWVQIKEKSTGREYQIEFGWEWEVTMDTFADLGTAMIIALVMIYFLMVAKFASFSLGGIIMMTFLLGFFGVFPGYTLLYILDGEYFSATSMIWVIALAGVVVGNAIILIEYMNHLLAKWWTLKSSIINAGKTRLRPIVITSLTTVLGITTILGDPVWSGLAWSIIFGLSVSALLTLLIIPVFLYDNLAKTDNK